MLLLKVFVIGLIGFMAQPDAAQQDENTQSVKATTVLVTTEPGEEGPNVIIKKLGEGEGVDGLGSHVSCSGGDKDVVLTRVSRKVSVGNIEAGGPWLGIQFGPVPKPLAVHLGIEFGQMVLNVMEGSPADVAGLQQYDVITSMGGQPVPTDIGEFFDQVRAMTPGQTQAFNVISKGRELPVSIVVGKRPDMQAMPKYKFDVFEELAQDNEFLRGGILHRGEGGNWRFDNLGALGDGNHFNFLNKLSNGEDFDFGNVFNWAGDLPGRHTTECRVESKDGKTEILTITCDDDKQITVTRSKTDENGVKTEDSTTYASEEELKQADPDAYDVLTSGGAVQFGAGAFGPNGPVFWHDFAAGGEDSKLNVYIQKMLDDASQATEEAKAAHDRAITLLCESMGKDGWPAAADMCFLGGKARISFESKPNGEITVTTRKGEEELVETFSSFDDLKARRPELAEKFGRLQNAAPTVDPK